MGYEGQPWTWCNNWGNEGEIKQRLDRALSSVPWSQTFENAKCSHITTNAFDHSVLLIDTNPMEKKKKRKFHFDKRWLQQEGIEEVIKKTWEKEIEGSRMFKVKKKSETAELPS